MQISELDYMTSVWVEENSVQKEYFVIQKDENSVVLFRKELLTDTHRMNPTNTSNYNGCEMDTWLENATDGFKSRFSSAVQSTLVARSVPYYNINDSALSYISRDIYLLSAKEIFNTKYNGLEAGEYLGGLIQMKCGNLIGYYEGTATAASWWSRSPYSAAQFVICIASGTSSNSGASNSYGVRPALSVARSATITYDEVGGIYLLNPSEQSYGEIEATVKVGSSETKPKKARVIVETGSLYDVAIYVSINAKDAVPVWEICDSNGEVTFANTEKSTENWEIGVKLTAKSTVRNGGYFREPTVIIET